MKEIMNVISYENKNDILIVSSFNIVIQQIDKYDATL